MSKNLNIEELFRSKLEGLEETPSPEVLSKTMRTLRRRQFMRFRADKFNIYYTAAALIVAAGLGFYFINSELSNSEEAQGARREAQGGESEYRAESRDNQSIEDRSPSEVEGQSSPNAKENTSRPNEAANRQTSQTENREPKTAIESAPKSAKPDSNSKEVQATQTENREPRTETVSTLIAYFTPSAYEGCAPLKVTFTNTSVNASSFTWHFGNSEPATSARRIRHGGEGEAATIYSEPGEYVVTLTAMNESGIAKTHTEIITVHPKPTASFEIEDEMVYNNSIDASSFEWFVEHRPASAKAMAGEGIHREPQRVSTDYQFSLDEIERSSSLEPRALSLVAKNSFGCTDTISSTLPDQPKPQLTFPTAFSPSTSGSSGGYYNPLEPTNLVFHPRYSEEPATYNLQIFNKVGELVFETNEIEVGWDGYHREAPASLGVYVYQCTGRWASGEPFNYRGDITVLWGD